MKTFHTNIEISSEKNKSNVELINSSNWQWVSIEALNGGSHRKYTNGNGQLLVASREALNSRGKGTRREAFLGGDMIE